MIDGHNLVMFFMNYPFYTGKQFILHVESNKRGKDNFRVLNVSVLNSPDRASWMCLQFDNVITTSKCKLFSHNMKSIGALSSLNQIKVELILQNAG